MRTPPARIDALIEVLAAHRVDFSDKDLAALPVLRRTLEEKRAKERP